MCDRDPDWIDGIGVDEEEDKEEEVVEREVEVEVERALEAATAAASSCSVHIVWNAPHSSVSSSENSVKKGRNACWC